MTSTEKRLSDVLNSSYEQNKLYQQHPKYNTIGMSLYKYKKRFEGSRYVMLFLPEFNTYTFDGHELTIQELENLKKS